MSAQRALFTADLEHEADPADSWSTSPEIMAIAHGFWPGGIDLDPCSNRSAIALGFVRARVAWTISDDCLGQPTWQVSPRPTCWLQPPYSKDGGRIIGAPEPKTDQPHPGSWVRRWDAGELWETLALVRLDSSTEHWRALDVRSTSLVLFHKRLDHYHAGVRETGSNFCSAMFMMTRAGDPKVRHRALVAAVGDLGHVYQ
jgi:hypothetical protein